MYSYLPPCRYLGASSIVRISTSAYPCTVARYRGAKKGVRKRVASASSSEAPLPYIFVVAKPVDDCCKDSSENKIKVKKKKKPEQVKKKIQVKRKFSPVFT
eukprot:5485060-Heterocapsa_arctica.AAC.1